jgi:hypothetical protein
MQSTKSKLNAMIEWSSLFYLPCQFGGVVFHKDG